MERENVWLQERLDGERRTAQAQRAADLRELAGARQDVERLRAELARARERGEERLMRAFSATERVVELERRCAELERLCATAESAAESAVAERRIACDAASAREEELAAERRSLTEALESVASLKAERDDARRRLALVEAERDGERTRASSELAAARADAEALRARLGMALADADALRSEVEALRGAASARRPPPSPEEPPVARRRSVSPPLESTPPPPVERRASSPPRPPEPRRRSVSPQRRAAGDGDETRQPSDTVASRLRLRRRAVPDADSATTQRETDGETAPPGDRAGPPPPALRVRRGGRRIGKGVALPAAKYMSDGDIVAELKERLGADYNESLTHKSGGAALRCSRVLASELTSLRTADARAIDDPATLATLVEMLGRTGDRRGDVLAVVSTAATPEPRLVSGRDAALFYDSVDALSAALASERDALTNARANKTVCYVRMVLQACVILRAACAAAGCETAEQARRVLVGDQMPWVVSKTSWLADQVVAGLLTLVVFGLFERNQFALEVADFTFWTHTATVVVLTEDATRRLPHVQPKTHLKALLATQVVSTVTHDVDIRRDVECRLVEALEIVAAAEEA